MVRNLAERLAAARRHRGCSGKGNWRWRPMADRLLGCAGRLVDRQHGVHCGALLTGFLHDSVLDSYRARPELVGDCDVKHELLRRPSRARCKRCGGCEWKRKLGWQSWKAQDLGATGYAMGRPRE